jgi:hypothetical protein
MSGGIFIRGTLLKSLFSCVVLALLSPNCVLAQSDNAAQRQFAVSWVAAIKSQDEAKVKALFHPATLACINDDNREYFDFSFKDELRTGARLGAAYKVASVKQLSEPPPLGALPEDGFVYPVKPAYQLQIEAETADHHPMYLIRFLAEEKGTWYTVDPCPNAKGVAFFAKQRAEGDKQMQQGLRLAAAMPEVLRAEVKQLVARGQLIDAMNRYRSATGADLGTAAIVIDAMAATN